MRKSVTKDGLSCEWALITPNHFQLSPNEHISLAQLEPSETDPFGDSLARHCPHRWIITEDEIRVDDEYAVKYWDVERDDMSYR